MKKLKYVGGGDFLPGVPAADHECSDQEAKERVASGLYVEDKSKEVTNAPSS